MFNDVSSPTLINCTVVDNQGTGSGGIWNQFSSPTIINSIIRNNANLQIRDDAGSQSHVTFSNVQGFFPGMGNINDEPYFFDIGAGDLRIPANSPCVDAGSNLFAEGTLDLDGHPRFVDDPDTPDCPQFSDLCGTPPLVDMGAFEFQPALGDFDGNGIVDQADYAAFVDCMNGPEVTPTPTPPTTPLQCANASDFDGDLDVDLHNFAPFQRTFDEIE